MELFEALGKVVENDTSRVRIVVTDVFAFALSLEDSGLGLLVDQQIDDDRLVLRLFGFFFDLLNSLQQSIHFLLKL